MNNTKDLVLDYSWGRTYPVIWYRELWWRWMPGPTVIVKKPEDAKEILNGINVSYSTSPSDHYGPWLHKNVGKQGWDWDWSWKDSGPQWRSPSKVAIKFRKGKERWATEAVLRWGA